ncbi:hypothetical protein PV328_009615 [Microctonus aethiopoides]|uniref:Uncharacterized protein n=1 Tax=Microctonus aethiopoides TaxID=144406 RepID=A0AA39F0X4_9HYME|nr:hypothetical protein PV328_009615 [Microctonus aethiopoides]
MWWSVTNDGNRVHLDTYLFHEVLQCRQFYPVSGTLSMNKERQNESPSVYSINSAANLVAVKSRDTYFKRRKKKTTVILLFLSLLIIILLAGIIALAIFSIRIRNGVRLCDSEDCIRTAASLKECMDTSIDPCDDFYKYACGRWPENHPTINANVMNSWFNERSDKVTWKVRDLLRQTSSDKKVPWAVEQAKILYRSCLDDDSKNALGLTPTFNLLKELTLPQIPALLGRKDGDFLKKIALVRRVLGKDIFIGIDVMVDPRNKSRNVIVLDTPSALSPLPGEIQKRLKTVRAMAAQLETNSNDNYDDEDEPAFIEKSYIIGVMMEIISNGTWNSCDSFNEKSSVHEDNVKKVAESIYELSGTLYYMSRADNNETITEENINDSNYMLIEDLQKITDEYVRSENNSLNPKPIWRPFMEELFNNIVDLDLDKKDRILVANLGYCKDLALFLTSTDEEMLETVIWWIVIDVVAPHSSKNVRRIWSDYIDKLIQIEDYEPMSLHCADVVNYMMGMAVARLFVNPEFHEQTGPKVIEMLEHIRDSFASLVTTTGWMDEETKMATLEKSKKMGYVIGHPYWLFNDEILNDYYQGIHMKNNTYLENMLMIAREATKTELEFLHETDSINKTYWAADPTEVNAVYTIIANHITLNYGAIGAILGHELTHGFDNSGRLYDSNGNLRQWWSNDTIIEYRDKTECFIKHYGTYYEKELTLDENIADNGGLREAIYAYQRWKAKHGQEPYLPGFTHLTHEQLLFLGFAHLWCEAYTPESLRWSLRDSHSPGHVRLKAVLTNSKEFSETWHCPVGSSMNPDKKCRIW